MLNRWQQMRQSRVALLVLMSIAMPVAFNVWSALLNNFVVERAAFTGIEIGILQSLREVPGFLAFTAIFVLLIIREQTFALVALVLLGAGGLANRILPYRIWALFHNGADEYWVSLF